MGVVAIDDKVINRFNSKIKVITSGCHEWTDNKHKGYGRFTIGKKSYRAHRVSWIIKYGEIKDKSVIMHTCDNPSCVNIEHLKIGTQLENIIDRNYKNRQASKEKIFKSKLNIHEIKEIREMYINTKLSQRKIAKKYNVSHTAIGNIVRNLTWKEE